MEEWIRSIAKIKNPDSIINILDNHNIDLEQLQVCAESFILTKMGIEPSDVLHIIYEIKKKRLTRSTKQNEDYCKIINEFHDGDSIEYNTEIKDVGKSRAIFLDLDNHNNGLSVVAYPKTLINFENSCEGSYLVKENRKISDRIKTAMEKDVHMVKSIDEITRDDLFEIKYSTNEHFFARICQDGRVKGVSISDMQKILNQVQRIQDVPVRLRITYAIRFGNRYIDNIDGKDVYRCIYPDKFFIKRQKQFPVNHHAAQSYGHIFQDVVANLSKKNDRCLKNGNNHDIGINIKQEPGVFKENSSGGIGKRRHNKHSSKILHNKRNK